MPQAEGAKLEKKCRYCDEPRPKRAFAVRRPRGAESTGTWCWSRSAAHSLRDLGRFHAAGQFEGRLWEFFAWNTTYLGFPPLSLLGTVASAAAAAVMRWPSGWCSWLTAGRGCGWFAGRRSRLSFLRGVLCSSMCVSWPSRPGRDQAEGACTDVGTRGLSAAAVVAGCTPRWRALYVPRSQTVPWVYPEAPRLHTSEPQTLRYIVYTGVNNWSSWSKDASLQTSSPTASSYRTRRLLIANYRSLVPMAGRGAGGELPLFRGARRSGLARRRIEPLRSLGRSLQHTCETGRGGSVWPAETG
jgi:hypothetical protein